LQQSRDHVSSVAESTPDVEICPACIEQQQRAVADSTHHVETSVACILQQRHQQQLVSRLADLAFEQATVVRSSVEGYAVFPDVIVTEMLANGYDADELMHALQHHAVMITRPSDERVAYLLHDSQVKWGES
jgi:hypothetical protein